jgi:putative ABC transport system permease protein
MQNLLRNLRFSLRMLRKNAGFTTTVIITLALGIGAVTAIYSVVYATLIADMPYPKPDEIVMVWSQINGHRSLVSPADYLDWQKQSTAFQSLKGWRTGSMNLGDIEEPEIVPTIFSAPGFYTSLGVRLALGRDLLPEEAVTGKDQVAIIGHLLWVRLGADPKIVGKTIRLNQKPYTVVGVVSEGQPDRYPWDVMVPLVFPPAMINRDAHFVNVMGRLKDGVTLEQANAEMTAIANQIAKENPRSNQGLSAKVESLKDDWLSDNFKLTLWLFLGASGFVLLIACVNIANLLLAKGMTRQKEIAVRTAIGATRQDVFIQFLTESVTLAILGGMLGVGVGYTLMRGIMAAMPPNILPGEAVVRLSIPVLITTLAATTFAGLLFGCAPAWYASRIAPAESLKEGARSSSSRIQNRLRQLLVIGEFALALTLLGAAGLAIHSFWNMTHVDLGVVTDHVLTFAISKSNAVNSKPEENAAYIRQVVQNIEALPGVLSASAGTDWPLRGPGFMLPFTISGQADAADAAHRPNTGFSMVTPDYFKTFGIRLVKGRLLTDADNASTLHVAVVNEQFVQHFMNGTDPLGKVINVAQVDPTSPRPGSPQPWIVVGVFHDVQGWTYDRKIDEVVAPFAQIPWAGAAIGVRTAGDPEAMKKSVSKAVHLVDPNVPLSNLATLDHVRDQRMVGDRFTLMLQVGFAVLALALAAVGIYGVIAFSVSQRTQEIGIRMALGAGRDRVLRMILVEGAALAFIGSVLGLVGAYFVGRAMHSMLFGVGTFDSTAFGAVSALLLLTAVSASYLPARRAASIEPMKALRTE